MNRPRLHKPLLLALAAVGILTAVDARADRDQSGNVYPDWCLAGQGPLLPLWPVGRALLPSHVLAALAQIGGERVILIRDDLTGWKREDAVRHENCHEIAIRRTGKPDWHRIAP